MILSDLIDFENFKYKWDIIENMSEFAELKI